MTAREQVQHRHATAFASWHQGDGCKIYYMIERGWEGAMTYIALSKTCLTEEEAWADAAEKVREG